MINKDFGKLARQLGYEFNDVDLLKQALTHRSCKGNHNERLEFIGDAVLGMVIADALYKNFAKASEGELTRMRSQLVKGQTLSGLAKSLNLSDWLVLGPGEMKSGGHRRDSILEDAVEAIIGAIYLDGGLEPCTAFVMAMLGDVLHKLDPKTVSKDPKTRLQEFLQSRKRALPVYEVVDITGQDHNQTFKVQCQLDSGQVLSASGTSRRKAEQAAARLALEVVKGE